MTINTLSRDSVDTSAPELGATTDSERVTPRMVYILALLMLISAFNYFDRSLLGLLAPMIRADIHISDTIYGIISGFAFVLFYALVGVPIAAYADRTSARNVIAIGFAVWSVMTVLTSAVVNAGQLAGARFLMGAGEACSVAPSNAMISAMFGPRWRTRALAIFVASSSISSIVLTPLGGIAATHFGWRFVFVAAGLSGLALAALFTLTVKDPPRPASDATLNIKQVRSLDLSFVRGPFLLILVSSALVGAHLYASLSWTAIFLTRVHHLKIFQIAVFLGPYRGAISASGVILAGYLTDRLSRHDIKWRLWLPALSCIAVAPSQMLFLIGDSRWIWTVGLGLESLFLLMHLAPTYSVAMLIAGPRRRAVGVSLMLLSSSLVGTSLGPLLIGLLNDHVFNSMGPVAIRYSMLVIATFPIGAGLMLALAASLLDRRTLSSDRTMNPAAPIGDAEAQIAD